MSAADIASIEAMPMFGFDVIYADPAWPFENYGEAGEDRNANQHYDTMALDEIYALPVGRHLASGDCVLFLWVTGPLLPQGLECMARWDFKYKTVGFTWCKLNRSGFGFFMGNGYFTRANCEYCLIGTIGNPGGGIDRAVRQLLVEPLREHSRKPDGAVAGIERLYPKARKIELFSRQSRPGWTVWGNEAGLFDGADAPLGTKRAPAGPAPLDPAGMFGGGALFPAIEKGPGNGK